MPTETKKQVDLPKEIKKQIDAALAKAPVMGGLMDKQIAELVESGDVSLDVAIQFSGARRMRRYLSK